MVQNLAKGLPNEGRSPESGHWMAAEAMEFPWRWTSGTMSTNLDAIWEMSNKATSAILAFARKGRRHGRCRLVGGDHVLEDFSRVVGVAFVAFVFFLTIPPIADAAQYKPIEPAEGYEHDRWGTIVTGGAGKTNYTRRFRAYVSVFDGEDDDDGDGTPDILGVPHFVAYEMRRYEGTLPKGPKRPSSWITDKELAKRGIAPKDASYKHSQAFLDNHPNWYDRGHLAMKQHAWRLGANADWNTHTTLNAVPQRHGFNTGIWLNLEVMTAEWADYYDVVWIIAGPIFEPRNHQPHGWLGEPEKGELPVGIPDKLFKLVIRQTNDPKRPVVLGFVYPQDVKLGGPYDHKPYLRSVDFIEKKTDLDFFTTLSAAEQVAIERTPASSLWPKPH